VRRRRLGGSACTKIFATGIDTHQCNADSTHADGVIIGKWGQVGRRGWQSRATVSGRFVILQRLDTLPAHEAGEVKKLKLTKST
jgi:hypothetical protein